MNKAAIITWISLVIFTIVAALFSILENKYVVFLIIGLSVIKFLGVAFQFMELKKAHSFWKSLIIIFIIIFAFLILTMH